MSRSNPQENGTPNPSTRWHEWNGEHGVIRYYDRDAKQNVDVGADFTFMLLDQLGSVRGWHEASESGIYSNEVRDTRQDVLLVKAFKGGILAEGIYKSIKDRVNTLGGSFNSNLYIAFKQAGNGLAIGSLRLKGAALGAWMEFSKANRAALYTKAVRIQGYTEGKKGRVTFRVPIFKVADVSEATNAQALGLDAQLQTFLTGYLARNKRDQVDPPPAQTVQNDAAGQTEDEPDYHDDREYDSMPPPDDIPFGWLLPLMLPALGLLGSLLTVTT